MRGNFTTPMSYYHSYIFILQVNCCHIYYRSALHLSLSKSVVFSQIDFKFMLSKIKEH